MNKKYANIQESSTCPACGMPHREDEHLDFCYFILKELSRPADCGFNARKKGSQQDDSYHPCYTCPHVLYLTVPGTFRHRLGLIQTEDCFEYRELHQCDCGTKFIIVFSRP